MVRERTSSSVTESEVSTRTLNPTMPGPVRYVLAGAIFVVALLLRLLLFPVEAGLPFLTFYPAVLIAFYLCGIGPGAWVVALSAAAGYFAFTPPFRSLSPSYTSVAATAMFLLSASLIGALIRQMQVTVRRLDATAWKLQRSEQRYFSLLEDQTDVICRFKSDGTIIYVNQPYCRLFGMPREALIGSARHPEVWPEDLPLVERQLKTLAPTNPIVTIENRVVSRERGVVWWQFQNRAFFNDDGSISEIQSVGRDIDQRKRLDLALTEKSRELQDLYDEAPCGYHSIDADGRYLRINETELQWLGCSREEVLGRMSPTDFFTPEGKDLFRRSFPNFKERGLVEDLEVDLIGRDGTIRRVSISGTAVKDSDGAFIMSRSVMFDVTERREKELKIEFLATHDQLTGLANRRLFYDRLLQSTSRATRKPENFAVFMLDLDDFKPVNDRHGHDAGDAALKLVARRLQSCVRNTDTLARLGGDEFGIILHEPGDSAETGRIAENIAAVMSQPFALGDAVEVRLRASIGIAIYGQDGVEVDTLMKAADRSMYASKARGKITSAIAAT